MLRLHTWGWPGRGRVYHTRSLPQCSRWSEQAQAAALLGKLQAISPRCKLAVVENTLRRLQGGLPRHVRGGGIFVRETGGGEFVSRFLFLQKLGALRVQKITALAASRADTRGNNWMEGLLGILVKPTYRPSIDCNPRLACHQCA